MVARRTEGNVEQNLVVIDVVAEIARVEVAVGLRRRDASRVACMRAPYVEQKVAEGRAAVEVHGVREPALKLLLAFLEERAEVDVGRRQLALLAAHKVLHDKREVKRLNETDALCKG